MTYEEVCRTFGKDGSGKNTVMARCPSHNDKEESLSISRGNGGKTLIHCFAGCNTKDIVEAVGLKMQDLYPEDGQQRGRGMAAGAGRRKTVKDFINYDGKKFIDRYDYYNGNGYVFTKVRVEQPTGGKTFRVIITDDSLEYVKALKLPKGKKQEDYCVVFPKEALKYAEEPEKVVFICEGEKDARNAVGDGLRAVTTGGATGSWTKRHAEYFKGLKVVVVPDNDPPGIKCALQEAKDLNGIAASITVIQWPAGFRDKGDYSDFVESFEIRAEGVKAFLELVDKAIDAESFIKEAEQSIADLKMKTSIDKGNESARKIENEDASGLRERLKELKPEEKYLTDDKGYARLFSDLFPECRASKDSRGRDWYFYDGKCWTVDTGGLEARERCKDMADALYLYAADMQREAFDIFRDSKNPKVQQAASYFKDVQTLGQLKKRQNIITDAISIQPISREILTRSGGILTVKTEFTI